MEINNYSAERIAESLRGKRTAAGWQGHCPAHEDKNPSLSISANGGKTLVHCHAGCSQADVIDALKDQDLWTRHENREKVTEYIYEDANGHRACKAIRKDFPDGKKNFYQMHLKCGEWVVGGYKGELKPYRISECPDNHLIFVVEGEKCVDVLFEKGLFATTTIGGSNRWKSHYAKHFSNRQVVILPDKDNAGEGYASNVYRDIEPTAKSVSIVRLPDLFEGEDIFDWFQKGHSVDELHAEIERSKNRPMEDLQQSITCSPKPLAEIEPKEISYLWENRIPTGTLTNVEGDGGRGKSTIIASICSRLSSGKPLPGDSTIRLPMRILLLAAEDDPERVLRPRYEANGADLNNIFFYESLISFPSGIQELKKMVLAYQINLVVIDSIVAFMGAGLDMNKSNEVRSVLGPLVHLGKETGCTFIVVRHFNKNRDGSAAHRGAGSVDFRNAARSTLQVIQNNGRSYLALEKSNYAARASTLPFTISESKEVIWGEPSDVSADDLLVEIGEVEKSAFEEATDFLREELVAPKSARDLFRQAREMGISDKTLRRAQKNLGIKPQKVVFGWQWALPEPQGGQDGQHSPNGNLAHLDHLELINDENKNGDINGKR